MDDGWNCMECEVSMVMLVGVSHSFSIIQTISVQTHAYTELYIIISMSMCNEVCLSQNNNQILSKLIGLFVPV